MKNLNKLFNECMSEVLNAGIKPGVITSVTVNTRAKKRWGQVHYRPATRDYTINISDRILADDVDDMAAKNTIVHEILHTVSGCMNHGENWKTQANRFMAVYPEYNISRCTTAAEKGVAEYEQRADRWALTCVDCGHEYRYKRLTKACANPENWKCGYCKGALEVRQLF